MPSLAFYFFPASSALVLIQVYSALLTLHSKSSGAETLAESPVEANRKSYNMALETNSQVVLPVAHRIRDCWPSAPRYPSPLVLDWMYRCIVACNGFQKDNNSLLYKECIEDIRVAMKLLSRQWAIGGKGLSYISV